MILRGKTTNANYLWISSVTYLVLAFADRSYDSIRQRFVRAHVEVDEITVKILNLERVLHDTADYAREAAAGKRVTERIQEDRDILGMK